MPVRDRAFFERLRKYDPQRTPDRRWQDACRIVEGRRRVSFCRDGTEVVAAVQYLRVTAASRTEQGREGVRRRHADLHEAVTLAQTGGLVVAEVQARILARQSDDEIAARCAVPAGAVKWYEAIFYETRDSLKAHDWILIKAIGPIHSRARSGPDLGAVWRSCGYYGGPLALEAVLAVSRNEPFPESLQPSSSPEDTAFSERLRLSTRITIDSMLLPPDADPRFLVRLHLKVIAEKTPPLKVKSMNERIDETLKEIPIRRIEGPSSYEVSVAGA